MKINILLACSAGMSTSMLEKTMLQYMKENNIDGTVQAHGSEEAKNLIQKFDIVLLGPQVRFMLSTFKDIAGNVPVEVISPSDYALAKGNNVVQYAISLIKK